MSTARAASDDAIVVAAAELESLRAENARLRQQFTDVTNDYESTIAEQYKRNQRTVHERDRLADRNEQLEATLTLYARTGQYLPVVGLVCDGDGCGAAIGVVGVKALNVDCVVPHAVAIAACAGWSTVEAPDVRPMHYCPSCTKIRR